jgi:hypothetical protein
MYNYLKPRNKSNKFDHKLNRPKDYSTMFHSNQPCKDKYYYLCLTIYFEILCTRDNLLKKMCMFRIRYYIGGIFLVCLKKSHSNQLYKGKNLYLHSEFYFDFIYKIGRKRQKINIHYKLLLQVRQTVGVSRSLIKSSHALARVGR